MTIMPASVLFPGAFYFGVYQIHSSDDVEIKQRLGPRTKKGFFFFCCRIIITLKPLGGIV